MHGAVQGLDAPMHEALDAESEDAVSDPEHDHRADEGPPARKRRAGDIDRNAREQSAPYGYHERGEQCDLARGELIHERAVAASLGAACAAWPRSTQT